MILKELDPFTATDKMAVAGRKAEEQMAFYLRRFFGSHQEVDVLNYLRIEHRGEVAQLDHLVLHPFGMTIVESKSVAGSVQIKDDGQWIRWFNKQPQGMRSPVTQARMQGMLLKELLAQTVKQKGFFDPVEVDVLVAISDSGTIQWPVSGSLPEVCKADQVPERILARSRQPGANHILTAGHRQVIADFLCKVHKPLARTVPGPGSAAAAAVTQPAASSVAAAPGGNGSPAFSETHWGRGNPLPAKLCKHCGSDGLDVQYGKFGYYFACRSCSKNTAIKFACPACGAEGRLRKQGKDFFAECRSCAGSQLYHTNG